MTLVHHMEQELQKAIHKSLIAYCEELGGTDLISPEAKANQLQAEVLREIKEVKQFCIEGFQNLYAALEELAVADSSIDFKTFKENFEQALNKLSTQDAIQKHAKKVSAGSTWSKTLGITEQSLELLYKAAQHIFGQKQYAEAETAFCFLTIIDPTTYAFWIGLGHARYHVRKFSQAVSAYQMATMCDPFSLWPYFYTANCYETENDFDQALVALEDAEECFKKQDSGDKELQEVISQRIAAIKQRG